jgi:hypothetical protein
LAASGTGWRCGFSSLFLKLFFLTFQAGGVETTTTFLRRTTPGVSRDPAAAVSVPAFVSGSVQGVFLHS